MKMHLRLVETPDELKKVADTLGKADTIAVDTEFIRETTFFPKLEIIQVATDSECWLIDVPAFKNGEVKGLEPLFEVLENKDILKIMHAAQGDQECLYTGLGVLATPTLDTSVAASLCGYGDGVGLANLLKSVLKVKIKKGHARTNWAARPLPKQLKEYALADVKHLVELGRALIDELKELDRYDWALQLSSKYEDKKVYDPDPAMMTGRLYKSGRLDENGYRVLPELMKWREKRVRKLNLPRKRLADDGVLMDLARVRPNDIGHLATFRGLNRGEVKNNGRQILDSIQRGLKESKARPPELKKMRPASADESRTIDFLRAYVGILADTHHIAASRLVSGNDFLVVIRSGVQKPKEFIDREILSKGAARLIGQELIDFLNGRRALSLDGRKVRVIKLDTEGNEMSDEKRSES